MSNQRLDVYRVQFAIPLVEAIVLFILGVLWLSKSRYDFVCTLVIYYFCSNGSLVYVRPYLFPCMFPSPLTKLFPFAETSLVTLSVTASRGQLLQRRDVVRIYPIS